MQWCLDQTGSTSIVQNLSVDKGIKQSPTIPVDTVGIQTSLNAPDPKFGQVEFTKGSGASNYGAGSVAVSTALNAPAKPVSINTIDKTEV